ncbi:MAG: NAD(P)H-hydrate dehydratase [Elusimicrobiota bacterium]|jgi:NAD(P)H-hydrate epimerase|nr:NAD(P)H-hydrate dehydratase [Elusimicrobiota bacterium]
MIESEIKAFAQKLQREDESHKYDYGHVLVIAGSKYMPGAGVLCCQSVLRTGAGLVTYGVLEDFLPTACAMSKPETLFFAYKNAQDILDYAGKRKVSALIIGPGLIESLQTADLIVEIISNTPLPVVIDASGLSSFANHSDRLRNVKAKLILTPHEGEFARLINLPIAQIKADGHILAAQFAKENNLVLVLKRHKTIVTNGQDEYINSSGLPAMATAGSGDVLSGIIAAFCATKRAAKAENLQKELFEAAKFGVWVHGLAGEKAAEDKWNGLIASDIVESIPYILKRNFYG